MAKKPKKGRGESKKGKSAARDFQTEYEDLRSKYIADDAKSEFIEAVESLATAAHQTDQQAWALYLAGRALDEREQWQEAISQYSEVVKQFSDADDIALKVPVAYALFNKGFVLNEQSNPDEAIACYDQVLDRFGDAEELTLKEQVAKALFNKGVVLSEQKKPDEAIACYDQVLNRFGDAEELALKELVGKALFNKGIVLGKQKKPDEAIACYDEVLDHFGDAQEIALKELVAGALLTKGIELRGQKRPDEAIPCYDQVLDRFGDAQELTLKEHVGKTLANKGNLLREQKKPDEAIACYDQVLDRFGDAEELTLKEQVVKALFNKGVVLSEQKKPDEAIACYDQVLDRFGDAEELALKQRVAMALVNKGVVLSEQKKPDEAIACYDQVLDRFGDPEELALKQQMAMALFNKAVVLAGQKKPDEAIACYAQVLDRFGDAEELALKQRVAIALFNKAVLLREQQMPDEALACYAQVLDRFGDTQELTLKEHVGKTLVNKGNLLREQKKPDEAIACYDEVLRCLENAEENVLREIVMRALFLRGDMKKAFDAICPLVREDRQAHIATFQFICGANGLDCVAEWENRFGDDGLDELKQTRGLDELCGFIYGIRKVYEKEADDFLQAKEAEEGRRKKFLNPESRLCPDASLFMVLRRWNSYTPAIPSGGDERSLGGGYFVWHNETGTVIDPGYNFIENFSRAGCRICDIHNVILTHAHNDHTIEFETLLCLLHEYNRDLQKAGQLPKKICVFLNNGSFMKFSGLLDLQNHKLIDEVRTLNPGGEFDLGAGLKMRVIRAFHDELVARDQSVGIVLEADIGEANPRRIVVTSDTGLFPLEKGIEEFKPVTEGEDEVWKGYGFGDEAELWPDIMVVHIGSIKEDELKGDLDIKPSDACYANHLGIIGTARVITKCRPRLAVVSEFGEEMRAFRCKLIEGLETKLVMPVFSQNSDPHVPRVVPGDLAFIYEIRKDSFYCCVSEDWKPLGDIAFRAVDVGTSLQEEVHYYSKNTQPSDEQFEGAVEVFRGRRKGRRRMYFRD